MFEPAELFLGCRGLPIPWIFGLFFRPRFRESPHKKWPLIWWSSSIKSDPEDLPLNMGKTMGEIVLI